MKKSLVVLTITVAMLVAVPLAQACSITFRDVTPRSFTPQGLVRPIDHEGARGPWSVQPSYVSVRPSLFQSVRRGNGERIFGVARTDQTAIQLYVELRTEQGYMLRSDEDPATAECLLAGQPDWQTPRILIRETDRAIFVTGITRQTLGDRTGCITDSTSQLSCNPATFRLAGLDMPVGDRRIVMQKFV